MADRLFGVESEYAFAAEGVPRPGATQEDAVKALLETARGKLPHLPGYHSSGIFLVSGGRFYVDCGLHPELTTPEVANPWDIARYQRAGERLLTALAQELVAKTGNGARAWFFKCNVDYGANQTVTWGAHDSYLHRISGDLMHRQILAHLVTRLIYSGAGGFDPLCPGLRFTLMPRLALIQHEVSGSSTHDRAIFHTKDEPLCGNGYHRLHLLCGENLCSETSTFLKVGTTALVVALIEAGLHPGDAVQLQSPLEAMRTFAHDPQCSARVELASPSGKRMTAVEIQRHYLSLAVSHATAAFMPPWTPYFLPYWQRILDRLEEGAPWSVATTLDWAIKYSLYEDQLSRRGYDRSTLAHWSHVVRQINEALQKTAFCDQLVPAAFVLGKDSPIPETVAHLGDYLRAHGLNLDGLRGFLELRAQFCEMDMRFGQLGPDGIFAQMDTAGVLDHHVPGVDNIEHAMANPPAIGRARLRGECIRRFAGNPGNYRCDWEMIWDVVAGRLLDLSEPFVSEERWQDCTPRSGGKVEAEMETQRMILAWLHGLRSAPPRQTA